MKARTLIALAICLSSGCSLNKKSVKEDVVQLRDLNHPWFTVDRINDSVWKISDRGEDNIYLIEGSDSALLIDTGIGAVNLVDFVKKITDLPLIVVNTHGHPDHVGSNNQFEKVYAHSQDTSAIQHFTDRQMHKQLLQYMVQVPIPDSLRFSAIDTTKVAALIPVGDGHTLDLGNRKLEIIHVPGHTPGSICVLDIKSKLLFTGDHLKELAWIHMEESLPLADYLTSLKKLKARENEFDTILGGHDGVMKKQFLSDVIQCTEKIISNNCQADPYESIVGAGLLCDCGNVKIAYNPKR